jgi:Mn2+/Fe2+ NRAMP family transporter
VPLVGGAVMCVAKVLGEEYVNKPWNTWVNWTIIILLFIMSAILAAQVTLPGLFPNTSPQ